ncbi:MAG: leucyl aminopeptidase family protein, partial [Caulobacterales bacterium]|nr:leucyl aminopeptidase family protein [Caulobacterales bacterium]
AGFKAKQGEIALGAGADGAVLEALIGMGKGDDPAPMGAAPLRLPEGDYALAAAPDGVDARALMLAWALGAYQFARYKSADRAPARLVPPEGADAAAVEREARAVYLARDLINTPTEDMGPEQLAAAAMELADAHEARARVVIGEALLRDNHPLVHAVGRAAAPDRAPRLVEFEWGEPDHPRIAVVGKGVCFDTGGLNIKTGDYMRHMKKDMGGAANALALAAMIMGAQLPCRLHVLVPMVENAVGPAAFRPGDVFPSRSGQTVEIVNTDAEGRLILADALARAAEEEPELIIDFATLTGAARVAVGPELAAYFTRDDALAAALERAAGRERDPVWRLPLWDGYAAKLDSPVADMRHLGSDPFAGASMAALFLQRFVGEIPWIHFDIYAWNPSTRPGRPEGGEAQGARAAFHMLADRLTA